MILNRLLRIARGAFATALTWGVAWAAAGLVIMLAAGRTTSANPDVPVLAASLLQVTTVFGIIGALNGLAFSITLAASERRRNFKELAAGRMALWGVIGGVSYPVLFALQRLSDGFRLPGDWVVMTTLCAVLGAFSAWGMFAIARRAAPTPGEEPDRLLGEYEANMAFVNERQRARVER